MDYAQLKTEVKEIAEIAAAVPEPFRVTCFEMLLGNLLGAEKRKELPSGGGASGDGTDGGDASHGRGGDLPLPAQVRVFMQRTGVTEQQLRAVVTVEEGEVHFLKEPIPSKIAQGQTQWALLLALRSGLLSNTFSVDPEALRSMCQEKGFYDRGNFAKYLKSSAQLFRTQLEPQGDAQTLSTDGQSALGDLVKSLAGSGG